MKDVGGWLKQINSKNIKRFVLSLFVIAALASNFLMPSRSVGEGPLANSPDALDASLPPRFNFLPGDKEMLRVANQTRGDASYSDPVNAQIGDRLVFLLYFHNGVINTVAHNTSVRVDLPNMPANPILATSYLWSDETPYITDTVINNKVEGNPGARINLPGSARIEYVPRSTTKITFDAQGKEIRTPLAESIVTERGINIGDIQGCWEYAGYVVFLADIKGEAAIAMKKEVAIPGQDWRKEIVTTPGAEVSFMLSLRNTGNILAKEVVAKDQLPDGMAYISGTTQIFNAAKPNGLSAPDSLFTTAGLPIPEMAPGDAGFTYVKYKVKLAANFAPGWHALANNALVYLAGVEQTRDQAVVRVFGEQVGFEITKKIVSGSNLVEQIEVRILDIITYHIRVKNTGNVDLANASIRDVLPQFVVYIPGSTKIDGQPANDQIISASGLPLGILQPGQERVITLQGKVDGCPSFGTNELLNTAFAKANGVPEIADSALAVVTVVTPPQPAMP